MLAPGIYSHVTINHNVGVLKRRHHSAGDYSFIVQVTDSAGNVATRPINYHVSRVTMYRRYFPGGVGAEPVLLQPFSQNMVPLGGTPPYSVTKVRYPAGMSIVNASTFSGVVQENGRYIPIQYVLQDSASNSIYQDGNFDVQLTGTPAAIALSGGASIVRYMQKGNSFSLTQTATGSPLASPNYHVSPVAGMCNLPPGLRLLEGNDFNNSGALANASQFAGTPTISGDYTCLLEVIDAAGNRGRANYVFHVSNLAFATTGFAPAFVGQPYFQAIDVRGGTPPYTFSLTSGTLPTGLNLNPATGVISGVPTTVSALTVTIEVKSGADVLRRSFNLNIYPFDIAQPNLLPVATVGQNYSVTFTTTGGTGPFLWTATGLPTGLTLNANTGVLSGKLTGIGVSNITVTAGNGAVAVPKTFTLFRKSFNTAKILQGLPTPLIGDYVLGSTVNAVLGVNAGIPPYTISLVSGSLSPGLNIVAANTVSGTSNFSRYSIAGVPTVAGLYTFRLRYQDSSGVAVERNVTMRITPLTVATTNLRPAIVNQFYSAQLHGVGGTSAYTYAMADLWNNWLPPGLMLSSTGLISGIPTSTGSFSFTLDQTSGTYTRRLSATVVINATADNRRLELSFGPRLSDVAIGAGYSTALTPTGGAGTHTWTLLSPLPPGLTFYSGATLPAASGLTPPSALIGGTFTTPGSYNLKVRVDDSTGNFAVRDALLVVTTLRQGPQNQSFNAGRTVLPGKAGVPYTFTYTAPGGRSPVAYASLGGSYVPAGFTFTTAGVMSGATVEAGNFTQNMLATDADGKTRQASVGFTIYPAGQPIGVSGFTAPGLPSATLNSAYSFDLNQLILPGYGTPPFSWAFVAGSGTLPPGLSIAGNILTGTPTATGSYVFDLMVTDANLQQHLVTTATLAVGTASILPIPGSSLPPAALSLPYSRTISAAGGSPPYTFRRQYNSAMPVGMDLSPSGLLSGFPTTLGKFLLQFEAVDNLGSVTPIRYLLDVTGTPASAITLTPESISATYTLGSVSPPSPVPFSVGSTGAAFPFTAAVSGGPWLSVSPPSGIAFTAVTVWFNTAGLTAGVYNGALTITSAGASNSPATIPVTLTVTAPVACSYSLSSLTGTAPAGGATNSFNVTTAASCNWTASSPDAWIGVQSPGSGTGSGPVNFTVAPNPSGTLRTGTVVVQGITHTVSQFGTSCEWTVSPVSSNVPAGGGLGQTTVNASAAGCTWSAYQTVGWVHILNGAGTGSGSLQYQVMANTSPYSRQGTIFVNGQPHTVNQAGVGCTYQLSQPGTSVSYAGGWASFNVTARGGCTWSVDPGPSWITHQNPLPPGNGAGVVFLSIAPNSTTATRTAAVLAGGRSFQVTQAGVPCNFSLSSNNTVLGPGAGGGTVNVSTGCNWVATSNANWLTVNPASGGGYATITFNVLANTEPAARSATLTVAGQNLVINQAGLTCSYSLRAASATSPSGGGPTSAGVVAAPTCGWSAQSNSPFLTITSGANYSGTADVLFTVLPNTTGVSRTGTLTVANQTFSVTQAPAPCAIVLGTSTFSAPEFGAAGSFGYTTSVSNCPHEVQSYSSWITITAGTAYAGTIGTVNFNVAANTFAAPRSGTIRVGAMVFTVSQAASTCAYTLGSYGREPAFDRLGGDGAIPMTFAPAQCGTPPVLVNGPPGMITLGPVISGPGTYTQNYTVGLYQSFINYVRSAEIKVNGQIYKVKQNSW